MTLLDKIKNRSAVVGVIGLGYVGLPLAILQVKTGFRVVGIEENHDKVGQLDKGKSYVTDISDGDVAQALGTNRWSLTTSFDVIQSCDIVLICLPTPLTIHKEPDVSAIIKVTHILARHIHPDMLVVLESTSYPGTTEDLIVPGLTKNGLQVGHDLFVAFSPERVDPGNPSFKTQNTFKLVGGVTAACCDIARIFYEQSISNIFPVSSTRVAELTKVFENVFRSVNIALVNELTVLCDRMGINVYEVIDAAATKQFGFMPFYPGPGVGGHCIPLDPYYLAWKAKEYDLHMHFIELAGETNEGMPYFVVSKLQRLLNREGQCFKGATVLVLGVTYKADISDPRESPATKVMALLQREGTTLLYADPFTPTLTLEDTEYTAKPLSPALLAECDVCLILTAHSTFDYDMVVEHAPLIFDTRNGTRHVKEKKDKVILLSAPLPDASAAQ